MTIQAPLPVLNISRGPRQPQDQETKHYDLVLFSFRFGLCQLGHFGCPEARDRSDLDRETRSVLLPSCSTDPKL
jgi:hypothetical protein